MRTAMLFLLLVTSLWVGTTAAAPPAGRATLTSSSQSAVDNHSARDGAESSRRSPMAEQAPVPPDSDGDRDRIMRMQDALRDILRNTVLRRTRVGIRVMEARTGRLFYEKRGSVLMDPASNQKVLATTAALMRLGADWRFRTELSGPAPDRAGRIAGDVVLRGSGDPTVKSTDLEAMAADLARRGVTRIDGAVVADPRRIGTDEVVSEAGEDKDEELGELVDETSQGGGGLRKLPTRAPLVVNHGILMVNVHAGAAAGSPADVSTNPTDESFVIDDRARTRPGAKAQISVRLSLAGARIRVEVAGRIPPGRQGLVFRRRVPQQALYSAVLLRAALVSAGIAVRDPARVEAPSDKQTASLTLLEQHESTALSELLRKINKDSNNDYAERVLEAAGAEVYGGAPNPEKGVRLLREVIDELGLPPGSYVPKNGSGLGHANRITADAMADLLRALYLDPRIGPEILQSLSVGGVDGTTRNRFKGTLAAHRVRAKTGTLAGKSCLSGLVGDGPDVLVFSILVDGLRGHALPAVRGAQVGCVNAMMRYVREAQGQRMDLAPDNAEPTAAPDYELGGEFTAIESEMTEGGSEGSGSDTDAVDSFLRKEKGAAPGAPVKADATATPLHPSTGKPATARPAQSPGSR
jgi:D-alanyl-D-alanine carboxypeptidase/D-alanyl-D-alanine-endopeptidase (penicillin-binding protein 4)